MFTPCPDALPLRTRIWPTSAVMAWTEFGTEKSPTNSPGLRPPDEARTRSPTAQTATFAGQVTQCLDRIISHDIIELPHQSLIGTKNNRVDHTGLIGAFRFHLLIDYGRYSESTRPRRVPRSDSSRSMRVPILVLPDARCRQGFHRAHDGLKIAGPADLSAQALRGVTHQLSLSVRRRPGIGFRLWLERFEERLAGDSYDGAFDPHRSICRRARIERIRPAGSSPAASWTACSAARHLIERHAVEEPRRQGQQHRDLRPRRHWRAFRLFEAGTDAPPMLDDLAGTFVQPRPEPCEGLQFLELCVVQLEVACDGPVGRPLRFAADA